MLRLHCLIEDMVIPFGERDVTEAKLTQEIWIDRVIFELEHREVHPDPAEVVSQIVIVGLGRVTDHHIEDQDLPTWLQSCIRFLQM